MSEAQKSAGAIFEAAVEMPKEERAAFLETACAGDAALRQRVESLIEAHDAAGSFMDSPALGPNTQTVGPPEPAELAPQFPQLEILELLGVGGMGMVYKARQTGLDRMVALKILPIGSLHNATLAGRFEREARALARLSHPGIVAVYDFGKTKDYYYFVMEYVDGMNLRQLLQTKAYNAHQALELVMQICTALQYAHDEKIVHRDIKPENILINKSGLAKIADFGLAKLLGTAPATNLTATQTLMGSINYMAPEQREKPLEVDHRADIYSLGVVFYEMLTGEVPMGRFDPPSKKVQVDVRLDEVVLHALEREPARRYQKASDVKTGVEAIATAMSPSDGRSIPAKKKERTALVGALLFTAIIAIVVAVVVSGHYLATRTGMGQPAKESQPAETVVDPERDFQTGYNYEQGIGVTKNLAEAVKWFRKAAEEGSANAQFSLGFQYEFGRGVKQDFVEAVKWYRKAEEAGNTGAPFNLAFQYEHGRGVAQDYSEAAKLYRKSAESGYDRGQDALGLMYEEGRGVSQDYAEAAKWYRAASESGLAVSQLHLGNLYEKGLGVPKDADEAENWYRKAANAGDSDARDNLTRLLSSNPGNPVTLKFVKADSEETVGDGANAVDGDTNTIWHTQYTYGAPPCPHEIILELIPPSTISGFTYLPRQDRFTNGTIKDYEFYVSDDVAKFDQPVTKGTFEFSRERKTVSFAPVKCRFIKLRALSEINGGPWTSAAEIGVIQGSEGTPDNEVQAGKAAGGEVVADIVLGGLPLPDAVHALANQAALNIVFDPKLFPPNGTLPNVTEKWTQVTALQALQAVLDNYGWQMVKDPGTPIFRISAITPGAYPLLHTNVNLYDKAQTNGAAVAGNEQPPVIAFDGVPLLDAMRMLAIQANLNIQFDPNLGNQMDVKATVKYVDVTPRQALQSLLDNYQLQMTQIPGNPILRVTAKDQ